MQQLPWGGFGGTDVGHMEEPLPSTEGADQRQEQSREMEQNTWETQWMRKRYTNLVFNPEQRR